MQDLISLKMASLVVATRHGFCPKHGLHKLSLRPFALGLQIPYTDIPMLSCLAGQQKFWDVSIYKPSEQLLATINCCKGHQESFMMEGCCCLSLGSLTLSCTWCSMFRRIGCCSTCPQISIMWEGRRGWEREVAVRCVQG